MIPRVLLSYNPSMPKETPGAENPFGVEKKEEELASTLEAVRRLDDYCQLVNEFLQNIKLPNSEKGSDRLSFYTADEHTISLQLGSRDRSYHIRDSHRSEEDFTEIISYEVMPEDKASNGNKKGCLFYDQNSPERNIRTDFNFNYRWVDLNPHNLPITFKGMQTLKIDKHGLHVPSAQQTEWDNAWRNFQKKLNENTKFHEFLLRIHDDQSLKQEDREWAWKFLLGGVKVEDANQFLREVGDYWRAATGKELKDKDIEALKDKRRPKSYIVPHQEVRDTIRQIQTRLQTTIREIDHRLNPRQDPYRTSARNQFSD